MPPSAAPRFAMLVPVSTLIVLTTASFAVNPQINDVETRQSLNPSGANTGAIHFPTSASRLSLLSATTLSLVSNVCKNQMMIVAKKMTVNALWMKSFALSHIKSSTLFADGKR